MEKFSLDISNIQVDETCNGDFLKLKLYAISDGVTNNENEFLFESFEYGMSTIPNKPILAYFNSKLNDVEEHNSRLMVDGLDIFDDYQYPEAEKPVGITPESSIIYTEQVDGKNWIVIENALIWTAYNRQLVKLLKEHKHKKVSVEVEILEKEVIDGIDRFKKWNWLGITILGKFPDGTEVHEGIEGAHLELVEFSKSDRFVTFKKKFVNEYNKKVDKSDILSTYGLKEKAIMALTMNNLYDSIRGLLKGYYYKEGEYQYMKYYVHDILIEESVVILEDVQEGKLVAVPYSTTNSEVNMHFDKIKDASISYNYSLKNEKVEVFLSKKEWGTGETIKVDTSKDAVSTDSWGDVNKTELRNTVLKAKNYKSLIKSVYLLVEDGWESAPASHLKYPVMQIKDNKAVYNEGGLLSAQQYAEKYDKTVARKAKRIRNKLGLTDKERSENMTKFIEMARDNGLVYIGTLNNKLMFVKEDEKCEDKTCEAMEVFEIECNKAKDAEEDFSWDSISSRPVKLSDNDEDDKDDSDDNDKNDKDKDDKDTEALKDELKKCKEELEKCKAEKMACEDELKSIRMEQMKVETEAVLEAEKDMDKEACDELRKMRDEGKFSSVEDFTKEFAYRKYVKQMENKNTNRKSYATFSIHSSSKPDTSTSQSIFDKLN